MDKDGKHRLHIFLKTFDDKHYDEAMERLYNHPISDATARLLKIKKSNQCKTVSYNKQETVSHNGWKPICSKYYVSSRPGVDNKLDEYFKKLRQGQACYPKKKSMDVVVCEKCAGHHLAKDCRKTTFVCHMCGSKDHRMFECKRAKCFVCLEYGHLANQCPTRNKWK